MPFDIPTAAELSVAGELQRYVDSSMLSRGFVLYPRGNITYGTTMLRRFSMGGIITGTGGSGHCFSTAPNEFDAPHISNATRLIYTGPANTPAMTLEAVNFANFENFSLERTTRGIGVLVRAVTGELKLNYRRVGFHNCTAGMQWGENPGDLNCGDAVYSDCSWSECNTGVLVKNHQGLNYTFESNCGWVSVDTCIHCEYGGNVNVRDCATYNVGTGLRVDNCGPNNGQFNIDAWRFDRNGGGRVPIVVDISRVSTAVPCRVSVDGITVAGSGTDTSFATPHYLFRMANPKGARHSIDIAPNSVVTDLNVVTTPAEVGPIT